MNEQTVFSDSFFAMGTRCDVVFTSIEKEFAEQIFQLVKNEIKHLEHRLSRFVTDSPLYGLNKTGKDIWVNVPDDLWEIITISFDFYQMSNGAFDITATSIINLWKNGGLPSELEIENAMLKSGFDKVEFDFENQKIKFNVDGVEFDLGGIGKGIALDSIKPILVKQGVKNGIVSFGESSVLTLGNHPNGNNWPIGIRNNYSINEFVHVFSSCDETITTSGTILSNDSGEIEKRNHIISPATGMAVETNKTISVKSESATLGEFLSTTWLILPENDKIIQSEKLKKVEILEVYYLEKDEYKTKLTIL